MPKTAAKKAVKEAATKKVAAKKTATKKTAAKKAVTKKVAAKKVAVKKVAAKKAAVKKTATKTVARKKKPAKVVTTIIAKIDAGFGNDLYIRGSGAGLSWDAGVQMKNTDSETWTWESDSLSSELEFKVLINDYSWSGGPNGVVFPGATVVFEPLF